MWAPVYRDQGHRVAPQGLMSSLSDIYHNNPVRQASVSASVRNTSRCLSDFRFGVCPMVQRLRRRRMHPGVQRDYRKDHTNLNKAGHLPIKLRYPQILWIDCGFPCGNIARIPYSLDIKRKAKKQIPRCRSVVDSVDWNKKQELSLIHI